MTTETADMEPETVMDGHSARDKTGSSTQQTRARYKTGNSTQQTELGIKQETAPNIQW